MTTDITQAIAERTDSLVAERVLASKGLTVVATPKLSGLHDAFGKFTERVEAAADKLHKRMESVGDYTENSIGKFSAGVDKIESTAKTIDDAANQMSNGAPPLDESPDSQHG